MTGFGTESGALHLRLDRQAQLLLSSSKADALLHAARTTVTPGIPLFQPGESCLPSARRSLGRQPQLQPTATGLARDSVTSASVSDRPATIYQPAPRRPSRCSNITFCHRCHRDLKIAAL